LLLDTKLGLSIKIHKNIAYVEACKFVIWDTLLQCTTCSASWWNSLPRHSNTVKLEKSSYLIVEARWTNPKGKGKKRFLSYIGSGIATWPTTPHQKAFIESRQKLARWSMKLHSQWSIHGRSMSTA